MRHTMPHRSNIGIAPRACKIFLGSVRPFSPRRVVEWTAGCNRLRFAFKKIDSDQTFTLASPRTPSAQPQPFGMAGMRWEHNP